MVELSKHSYSLFQDLDKSSFSCSHAAKPVLPRMCQFLQKDQQSYEDNGSSTSTDIELVSEHENPNDISPGFSATSVNMYDFDSSFDHLPSDATSAVQNVEKRT